jgi:UDP-N-acetylglucosamine--N-acetylmuramyl-(pentapeptide) pyrophosphoryl-undecaprenol N-acetylglucosamine transferase
VRNGLPAGLSLVWATGQGQFAPYESLASERVRIVPYLSPIAEAYAAADVAITRAGAMTCAELTAWGIPGVMVPLPTAAADHQTTNARALQDAGCAVCLPQAELTGCRLINTVVEITGNPQRLASMSAAATTRGRPGAAQDIARRVLTLINSYSEK